ncbi:MAG: FRG domain-containing protein [bacterium]|nr:FRG domain-containing protein [bacterium]
MERIKITSYDDIKDILKDILPKGKNFLFRGQPQQWMVQSSAYRRIVDHLKEYDFNEEEKKLFYQKNTCSYHEKILKGIEDRIGEQNILTSEIEKLAYFQHYGGATFLIDFTGLLQIAIYFAIAEDLDKDGQIFCSEQAVTTANIKNNACFKGKKIEDLVKLENAVYNNTRSDINTKEEDPMLCREFAQNSYFIFNNKGYLDNDQFNYIIDIPSSAKKEFFVKKCTQTTVDDINLRLYPDLLGFCLHNSVNHEDKDIKNFLKCILESYIENKHPHFLEYGISIPSREEQRKMRLEFFKNDLRIF